MTLDGWRPLLARDAGGPAPEPVLLDGVPEHLRGPLRDWLIVFFSRGRHAQRVALQLQVSKGPYADIESALIVGSSAALLDVVDAALYFHPDSGRTARSAVEREDIEQRFVVPTFLLMRMLADASSAWTVTKGGRGLERRVDATVQAAGQAAEKAAADAGRPEGGIDLAGAWAKVYGIHPDPSEAYRLAIRAVEDVSIPLVLPNSRQATLGKVRDHLRDAPAKWRLSMGPDTEPLLAMVNLLWTRQTDRHAGQADLERVDLPAAEQALHLATTLVQWFAAGHVQRVP